MFDLNGHHTRTGNWYLRFPISDLRFTAAVPAALAMVAPAQAGLPCRLVRHSPKGDGGSLWAKAGVTGCYYPVTGNVRFFAVFSGMNI
jgi:hypothetical protein